MILSHSTESLQTDSESKICKQLDSNRAVCVNTQSQLAPLIAHLNLSILQEKMSFNEKIFYCVLALLLGLIPFIIWYIYLIVRQRNLTEQWEMQQHRRGLWTQHSSGESTYKSTNEYNDMSLTIIPMTSNVRFKDIAGIGEAKDELLEIIDYLKNPKKYQDLGIYLPKGVLLAGPPGVGKTMIAKAVAGESGVPFFYQSGSSFVQMYVGIGAQRVRELFAKARANAPAIIFIDEIDAIGKMRGIDNHQEWESTLNELLTQMDGFSEQSGIIVIGATNQAENIDSALLRSGRFDRRIFVDLPDMKEREEILRVYLKQRNHTVNIPEIARLCVGFSGANIASLINEAAINALRHKRDFVTTEDILATSDKVIFGTKKQSTLSREQKRMIAIYNAGKAISQYWLLPDFDKISLVAYNNMQQERFQNLSECILKSELITQIKIALSGNIALEIEGLESASLAKNDLALAKKIAATMCKDYGMGSTLIGTQEDVAEILAQAQSEHRDFIQSHKQYIFIIANALLEKEKLDKEDMRQILALE
ncbi:AAA family ATPase [Helicobacter sp. MIT 14-3879]|nr:AAA family ATPase [Helicobacter sp. MIT 14-3879]